MKAILVLATALLAVASGLAKAADLSKPPPVYTKAPMMPAYDWTGIYVGLNAGGAWGDSEASTSTVFSPTAYFSTTSFPAIATAGAQSVKPNAFTGGGQLGYNWQASGAVLGLEADIEYFGLKGSVTSGGVYPCCAPTAFTITQSVKTDWLATFRARLGYLVKPGTLIYVTGGAAVTNLQGTFRFTDTFAAATESASFNTTKLGWTAGGGVEWTLWEGWSAKGEYLFISFPTASVASANLAAFVPPIAFPTNVFTHSADLDANIVRVGLNYKFD